MPSDSLVLGALSNRAPQRTYRPERLQTADRASPHIWGNASIEPVEGFAELCSGPTGQSITYQSRESSKWQQKCIL